MKELTEKEKAQRYDEALKRAKGVIEQNPLMEYLKKGIEYILPELKESEDERIRKALINGFNKLDKSAVWYNGITNGQILTWLEKQAQKLVWSEEDKNMLGWVIGYLENKMLNTPISEERTACKNAVAWFEEKLKDEPNLCDGCINRKGCINCENGELRETEQKPAKVEPKFKVGDWVINNQGNVHQIGGVIENVTNHTYGYDTVDGIYFKDNTEGVRLWTINDAKDGDVLTDGEMVVIFKQFDKPVYRQHIIAHIGLDICGDIQVTDGTWELKLDKVKPATKTQRDLLFSKMKESGYEWDAEKKELKKAKQNPIWSKDDEKIYQSIMDDTVQENQLDDKQTDWLKSLRDRVQSQWKPSDEQMKALDIAIRCGIQLGSWEEKALKSLKEQLFKLKKLRDEQL